MIGRYGGAFVIDHKTGRWIGVAPDAFHRNSNDRYVELEAHEISGLVLPAPAKETTESQPC